MPDISGVPTLNSTANFAKAVIMPVNQVQGIVREEAAGSNRTLSAGQQHIPITPLVITITGIPGLLTVCPLKLNLILIQTRLTPRVGYGRMEYQRTLLDIRNLFLDMTDEELVEVFQQYGNHPALSDGYQSEAHNRTYQVLLKPIFRIFRPAMVMRHDLEEQMPLKQWSQVRNIYQQLQGCFADIGINTADADIQEIFRLSYPLRPDNLEQDTKVWLWSFAPSAADLIVNLQWDEIYELIDNYQSPVPPLADFSAAVKQAELDQDEIDDLLELLNMKLEQQP